MNAIQAFVPSQIVKTFTTFLNFCYIARRNIITGDSLEQLNAALHKFHESRQVFSGTVRANGLSGFSLPRQHAMVHYYDHIKNFGSPNGLCSSITESKHIAAVKRPWRRSNKHAALPQMLKVNERLDKLAAARADFTARGMLVDSCLVQAIKDISSTTAHDIEDPMDEDASNSDESDSDILDEIRIFNSSHTNTLDLNCATPEFDDISTRSLNDTDDDADAGALDDPGARVINASDGHPHTPRQHSPAPPDNEEDDDHGPVESGPLMNEVRLASRKG
jgi:hypothetical protein